MVSISAIKPFITKGFSYAKRGVKVYLPTVFGEGNEVMSKAYKANITTKNIFKKEFWKNLWNGTKAAGKAAEGYATKVGGNKAFLSNMWKSIKTAPKTLQAGARLGRIQAAAKGSSKFLGSLKGIGKALGKKMPIIGSLLILGFELPNIIKATKEKGIVQGVKETLKAGAKLGGMTLGMAIGTALGGPLGGLVGAFAGDWLAGKIVGKSYSEKVAQQEVEQQTEQQATNCPNCPDCTNTAQDNSQVTPQPGTGYTTNPFQTTLTQEQLEAIRYGLYGGNNIFDGAGTNNRFNYMA